MNACFWDAMMGWVETSESRSAALPQQGVAGTRRPAVRWRIRHWGVVLCAVLTVACESRSSNSTGQAQLFPPDSTLRAYVLAHQPVLDSLVTIFRKRARLTTVTRLDSIPPDIRDGKTIIPNHNAQLHDLLVRAQAGAIFADVRYPHCIFVRWDSLATSQAGFVNVGEGCTLAAARSDRVLTTAPAVGEWSVYHTR